MSPASTAGLIHRVTQCNGFMRQLLVLQIHSSCKPMKIPENESFVHEANPVATLPEAPHAIAPWWHTAILIVLLLGISLMGGRQTKKVSLASHHVSQYLFTFAWEWILAALVLWGLWMRRTPLRQILGIRRDGLKGLLRDARAAFVFWIMALIVLTAVGTLLQGLHFSSPQKSLMDLAPQGGKEILLWVTLSISAGICEELLFRGYLLQQFVSMRSKLWVAALASSLLFGMAHGYEGASGMIAITAFGAMFCMLAIKQESLRAGMIAHAWHDAFSGIMLALMKHFHAM